MNKLVSVIITNYNYGEYIGTAIESALIQDYKPIEIIVVDDGSSDNSIEIISTYLPKIKLLQKVNGGVSSARNLGIENSLGSYVAFLDADDFWDKNKISQQIRNLEDSKTLLNYCGIRFFSENKTDIHFSEEKRDGNFYEYFLDYPSRTPFPPSSVLMSIELAQAVGEWDINLMRAAEDWDYFRRAAKFSDFSYTNQILVSHREHPYSLTSGPLRLYFRDNHKAYVKMLIEERDHLSPRDQRRLIRRFHYIFIKSFIKHTDLSACFILLRSIFRRTEFFYELEL